MCVCCSWTLLEAALILQSVLSGGAYQWSPNNYCSVSVVTQRLWVQCPQLYASTLTPTLTAWAPLHTAHLVRHTYSYCYYCWWRACDDVNNRSVVLRRSCALLLCIAVADFATI